VHGKAKITNLRSYPRGPRGKVLSEGSSLAIRATPVVEGTGVSKSVRELLDDARAAENTDIAAARSMAQQARVQARTIDDGSGEAEALYRLASVAFSADQSDEAFSIALDARELARKVGATVVEVWALNLVGLVQYNAGNYSEALETTLQALELYRLTDHRIDEGNLLNSIAIIHHSLGDTDRALVTYEAALTANKWLDRPDYDVLTLTNMAEVRAGRNEHLVAISLDLSALELAREHAPVYQAQILARLGMSYCSVHELESAEQCLDEAEAFVAEQRTSSTDTSDTKFALAMVRGRVAMERGDDDGALRSYELALQIALDAALLEKAIQAHAQLASSLKKLGRFEEALEHQEARFAQHAALFSQGTDLRIKTLQIAHDTEAARQQAEILRLRTGELEALVRGRTSDLEEYQLEAFQRLAVLAEFRDTDTGEHTIRVGDLSAAIAKQLGESDEWVHHLRLAGRLHDIGKVAVPDSILLKPGPLTVDEFDVMKTHTTIGAEILSGSASPLIQLAAEVALNHHERWDGSGYPNGLVAEGIPLSGRIVTVADVFDALTSHRTYKHAWTPLEAIQYIIGAKDAQFEARIVDAFVEVALRAHPEIADEIQRAVA
jgi:putative two-component system response regulator